MNRLERRIIKWGSGFGRVDRGRLGLFERRFDKHGLAAALVFNLWHLVKTRRESLGAVFLIRGLQRVDGIVYWLFIGENYLAYAACARFKLRSAQYQRARRFVGGGHRQLPITRRRVFEWWHAKQKTKNGLSKSNIEK